MWKLYKLNVSPIGYIPLLNFLNGWCVSLSICTLCNISDLLWTINTLVNILRKKCYVKRVYYRWCLWFGRQCEVSWFTACFPILRPGRRHRWQLWGSSWWRGRRWVSLGCTCLLSSTQPRSGRWCPAGWRWWSRCSQWCLPGSPECWSRRSLTAMGKLRRNNGVRLVLQSGTTGKTVEMQSSWYEPIVKEKVSRHCVNTLSGHLFSSSEH